VQLATSNYQPATADHRPTEEAVPALTGHSCRDAAAGTDSDERTGRGHKEARGTRDGQGPSIGVGGHVPGQLLETVSDCHFGSGSGSTRNHC